MFLRCTLGSPCSDSPTTPVQARPWDIALLHAPLGLNMEGHTFIMTRAGRCQQDSSAGAQVRDARGWVRARVEAVNRSSQLGSDPGSVHTSIYFTYGRR